VIAVTDLAKSYGAQTLFEDASFQLNPGGRYGLVGANGSGKTTLMRILLGAEEPTRGTVSVPKRLRLGTLRQDQFVDDQVPIVEAVMRGHDTLWSAMEEKHHILERADVDFDADRYQELEDVILAHDGYAFEARCGEILEGLGIPTRIHHEPLGTLSGGFKLRVLLARVLASEPGALLLDEPTNHLDIVSIRWLEKFLVESPSLSVVISHDHRFLDNVCTHILDVDYETVSLYTGDYSDFVRQKAAERERREAEIAKREKEIADHQAFVDRFRAKASKARQAQSKVKMIEKTVIERLPPSSRRYPVFAFHQRRPSGKSVLEVEGLAKAYGDNTVLEDVDLHVRRGDRVAIIGPNGIGKSTLLKIVTGRLEADAGEVRWGHETYPGYFAQDHRDLLGKREGTVESWLGEACPGKDIGWVRGQLGKVLFSGDEVGKRIASLSGGEAARLIFSRLGVEQPNVLVLDEPTNHLDLEAIEALVEGLRRYDGTLLFVSHDRWFVARLASRIIEITANGINDFPGGWDDYLAACGDDHLDADLTTRRARRPRGREGENRPSRGDRSADRELARRRADLELRRDTLTTAIEEAETRIENIDARFCEPGFFDDPSDDRVRALQRERDDLQAEVEKLLADWEAVETELAELQGPSDGTWTS
jgi:ATPase subunit of ABC transporter with duplicated ATPase domains